MSYLDVLIRKVIQIAGTSLTERRIWNLTSGFTGVDNPTTGATDLYPYSAPVTPSAYAIDWNAGQVFAKTLGAGARTFTFSNATSGMSITVAVTGSASTLTWPTVRWAGGTPPTQTSSGIDIYTFLKIGTHIYGSVVQDMS